MRNLRLNLSASTARATPAQILDSDDLDEEPGEEIESAPPLGIGEERMIGGVGGLKKKLKRPGYGWETPLPGDEVTIHYEARLRNGCELPSTRDLGFPISFNLGSEDFFDGLDQGILTMKKNELALFEWPCSSGSGPSSSQGVAPGANVQFEVELISWQTVKDICKDGGIIKKVISKGDDSQAGDLDEVTVKYQIRLPDGKVVAETPVGGFEFYVNQGHLCPAIPKIVRTMRRGEKALVAIQPKYAFGETGREANHRFPAIPSNTLLIADMELVSLKPGVDVTGDMKSPEAAKALEEVCTDLRL